MEYAEGTVAAVNTSQSPSCLFLHEQTLKKCIPLEHKTRESITKRCTTKVTWKLLKATGTITALSPTAFGFLSTETTGYFCEYIN
jgi:hypothetical protein